MLQLLRFVFRLAVALPLAAVILAGAAVCLAEALFARSEVGLEPRVVLRPPTSDAGLVATSRNLLNRKKYAG